PQAAPPQAAPAAPPAAVQPASEPPGDSFGLAQEPSQDSAPTPAPAPVNRPTAPPKSRARASSGSSARAPTLSGGTFASLMARIGIAFPVSDVSAEAMHDADRWSRAGEAIDAALAAMASSEGFGGASRDDLAALALREAVGLGALDELLANDDIAEIIVEGPGRVLADSGEGLNPTGASFSSASALRIVALRLLGGDSGGGAVRHATLPNGAHATVILPPVAVGGPVVEIRRGKQSAGIDALVPRGMLDATMAELLKRAISTQQNVAVVGPASSGVSTMLGALASAVDAGERLVLVEGQPDIRLDRDQVIALHASGGETLSALARQASRLRCDRLVIDDVGADDTLAVLKVMASRGEGALAGFHAAGSEDPFTPLKVLASVGQHSSMAGLDDLIATAVDVVVRMGREGGARRVLGIIEVTGVDAGIVQTQPLYEYDDGFSSTGAEPGF
ncbi:MAG: CpaF family protein, partial [Deltaproteobacteria bacterium]|nr:CpaF family protein [Deltaproteobacteria bacterium]